VGSPNFSAGQIENISIAIDSSGTPYVAYMDVANGAKATVMKFNGTDWVGVGSPGFSASWAEETAIALDTGGTPYVVYDDALHYHSASVMKFSGGSWVLVGSATLSDTTASAPAIAIDKSGTPYVVYSDGIYGGAATAQKFNGTSWVFVGSPGFTPHTGASDAFNSIAIDNTGNPYVAFSDQAYASVMKFDGSSWGYVGSPDISIANTWYTSIALNKSGVPYVTFTDAGASFKATVMKFDSSLSAITGMDTLCVGFTTALTNTTMGGTWSSSNTAIATIGSTSGVVTGVASGTTTISYIAYGSTVIATVNVVNIPLSGSISGSSSLCVDSSITLVDTITGGVWSNSNPSVATVGSSGIVNGIAMGVDTISYSVSNGYCTSMTSHTVTVDPCTTGIENKLFSAPKITIFPIPTYTSLTILAKENVTSITITNLLGQTVYSQQFTVGSTQTVDVSGFAAGVYFVKVNDASTGLSLTGKFVKE